MFSFLKRNRVAIYTAIFGSYDSLREQPPLKGVDYICFTDNDFSSDSWTVIHSPPQITTSSRYTGKVFKILNHHYFRHSHYDYSIWIDGRVRVKSAAILEPLSMLSKNSPTARIRHPERDCLYEEAAICRERELDTSERIDAQVNRYRNEGFPEKFGLHATTVHWSNHHSDKFAKLHNLWWKETYENSCRDQLSFDYASWKTGVNCHFVEHPLWDNDFFKVESHDLRQGYSR